MSARPRARILTPARLVSIALATASWAAQAQTETNMASGTSDPAQLGKISVEAEETDPTSYTAPAVTIGKTEQSLREIPQSVSVITRQRIEDQNLATLDEAVAQSTGITVTGAGGATPLARIYSRGFEITTIQRDGVPMQYGVSAAFAQPDLAIYDRVEVLRGASGLFAGAGQPGGTINLVRKRALAEMQFQTTASAGSWDNYRLEADLTGALNSEGTLRGRAVAAYRDQNYFFDVADSEATIFYGRLEYDLADSTFLTVGGTYEKRDEPYTNGVPRYSTGADLDLDRSAYLSAAWSSWDFEKPEVFAELEHSFNREWKGKISLTRATEDSDYKTATVNGAVNPSTLVSAPIDDAGVEQRRATQDGLDVSLSGGFEALGQRQELVVGANYWEIDFRQSNASPALGPYVVNVFNFDPFAIPEPTAIVFDEVSKTKTRQSGYYAALRLRPLSRLTVSAGARWSSYSSTLRDALTGATTSDYEVSNELTPYGGLVYDLNHIWSLYGSYAEIFQAQDRYTFEGDLLPPLVGANYEAGIKGEMRDGALNVSLALFRIDQTNRSQSDPAHPSPCLGSPTRSCFVAEGEVRSEGVEAEITGRLLPEMEIFAGYTYNSTEYLKDRTATGNPSANEGNPFSSFTPKHIFRLWANYQPQALNRRLSIGAGINAQSSWYVSSGAIRLEQSSYALWNASASYALNNQWTVSVNGNNLLDETYYQRLGNLNYASYYGEPRNFMLRVRANF